MMAWLCLVAFFGGVWLGRVSGLRRVRLYDWVWSSIEAWELEETRGCMAMQYVP
jgi:hypothetical protein